MKLKPATIAGVTLFCVVVGTLTWEVLERVAAYAFGEGPELTVGPYGFDIGVLAVWVRLNPGSILAIPGAILLLRRL